MAKEIKTTVHAFPGEKVWVRNYRRDGFQERGKVVETEIIVYNSIMFRNKYRIQLDRKTTNGRPMFLYVGDDGII